MLPCFGGFPGSSVVKNPPAMQEMRVWSLGGEDPLEEGMATHSSIPAWKIPWTEEPGGLQYTELQRVGHGLATKQQQYATSQSRFTKLLLAYFELCVTLSRFPILALVLKSFKNQESNGLLRISPSRSSGITHCVSESWIKWYTGDFFFFPQDVFVSLRCSW